MGMGCEFNKSLVILVDKKLKQHISKNWNNFYSVIEILFSGRFRKIIYWGLDYIIVKF